MGGRMMKSTMFILTAVMMMVINGIAAEKLMVGDGKWSLPSSPGFYDQWAAKQNFAVGDTLVFEFATGKHDVASVTSKEAYEKCDASLDKNAVITTEGPCETTLTSAGQYYYFCSVSDHCARGQKFTVNVSATQPDGSPSSPTPPNKNSAVTLTNFGISTTFVGLLALLY